jgi:hypothetical protein
VRFEEFVQFVLSSEKQAVNEHWMTYQKLCQPCLADYTYISTAESSSQDAPRILSLMDVEEHIADFHNMHQTKPSDDFYRDFYGNISVQTVQQLVTLYRTDMEMFGYSWQEYLFGRTLTPSS